MATYWQFEHRVTKEWGSYFYSLEVAKQSRFADETDWQLLEISDAAYAGYIREHRRSYNGEYERPLWASSTPDHHYVHVSKEDQALVAYTPTPRHAAEDRQLRVRPGRYLASIGWDNERIKEAVAEYDVTVRAPVLRFALTPDEIEAVYLRGPTSCMSHGVSDYRTNGTHPVRVYGAGDLAIAYIGTETRVTARALCWPTKMVYSRVYGDAAKLKRLLEAAGYHSDNGGAEGEFDGAKLLRLECDRGIVAPYIDYYGIDDCGDHLVIRCACEYSADETNGLLKDNGLTCCSCGERYDDEDHMQNVDDDLYCEYCFDERFYRCDACSEAVFSDDTRGDDDGQYCEDCFDRRFTCCERCDEHVRNHDIITVDDRPICRDCCDEHYSDCEECGETFENDDLDEKRHCEECAAKLAESDEVEGEDKPHSDDPRQQELAL